MAKIVKVMYNNENVEIVFCSKDRSLKSSADARFINPSTFNVPVFTKMIAASCGASALGCVGSAAACFYSNFPIPAWIFTIFGAGVSAGALAILAYDKNSQNEFKRQYIEGYHGLKANFALHAATEELVRPLCGAFSSIAKKNFFEIFENKLAPGANLNDILDNMNKLREDLLHLARVNRYWVCGARNKEKFNRDVNIIIDEFIANPRIYQQKYPSTRVSETDSLLYIENNPVVEV